MIDKEGEISIVRQCELLGINRSTLYYHPATESAENLNLMNMIDEQYTKTPFYGSRKMAVVLGNSVGKSINRKRIQRLMRVMGIEAIYAKPKTTNKNKKHEIYPYLLHGVKIERPNQVWSTDITYIRMHQGFLYMVAIMDWFSRYVLSWEVSNTLDKDFCITALNSALDENCPEIFNSDQGSQFTSNNFTNVLKAKQIRISMDGQGRAFDNIFVERLWRTLKYEEVYFKHYETVKEALDNLSAYWKFYNFTRPHQALGYKTPAQVYFALNSTQD